MGRSQSVCGGVTFFLCELYFFIGCNNAWSAEFVDGTQALVLSEDEDG